MPLMETVTIINKSGKVVSTGKHLVNIFKDTKDVYMQKKAELKAEHQARATYRNQQKLAQAREELQAKQPPPPQDDTQSVASSHRSKRSHRSRSHRHSEDGERSRPPLTNRNLDHISERDEGSVASSRRSHSHHGSRRARSPDARTHVTSRPPLPGLTRRHTEAPARAPSEQSIYMTPQQLARMPPTRTQSNPDFGVKDKDIDMNLAYGKPPPDLQVGYAEQKQQELELAASMNKIDELLMEAQCIQHSATAMIANLQANPEAMAAVALTLAEVSNLLTKMSPSILTMLKTSSPAVFALLASPQFLIAGGVALGVTIVMFGGYKIIKKIQDNNSKAAEPIKMEEAMVYDNVEMGSIAEMSSIETWRRGIADEAAQSEYATSVDGEFITPEAARQKKEQIRERRREERAKTERAESVVSESVRSERSARTSKTTKTVKTKTAVPVVAPSEVGSSVSKSSKRPKEIKEKKKAPSTLSMIFKKNKDHKEKDTRQSVLSHRPRVMEMA